MLAWRMTMRNLRHSIIRHACQRCSHQSANGVLLLRLLCVISRAIEQIPGVRFTPFFDIFPIERPLTLCFWIIWTTDQFTDDYWNIHCQQNLKEALFWTKSFMAGRLSPPQNAQFLATSAINCRRCQYFAHKLLRETSKALRLQCFWQVSSKVYRRFMNCGRNGRPQKDPFQVVFHGNLAKRPRQNFHWVIFRDWVIIFK